MTTRATIAVLCALALGGCSGEEPPPVDPYGDEVTETFPAFRGQVPRNIVMISIDTLRKDHLARYGGGDEMDFLSGLADRGVALDDFDTCSNWTYHSIACTLLGTFPRDVGMVPILSQQHKAPMPDDVPFLATRLGELGFFSVLTTTNGWFSPEWNNVQGYDIAFVPPDTSAFGAYVAARDQVLRFAPDRFFMHVHTIEPHAAYRPPQKYLKGLEQLEPVPVDLTDKDAHYNAAWNTYEDLTEEQRALLEQHLRIRYQGELAWLDDQIEQIVVDLARNDMLDDTLLVFWSDHGEAFWEHGVHTHAYTLHAEETDGVAIFWSRNIVQQAVAAPTSSIDIAPTLMQLYAGEVPESMTGLPADQVPMDRPRWGFSVARQGAWSSVELEGRKLMYNWFGGVKVYDTVSDPGETVDLYDPADPVTRDLWDRLLPRMKAVDPLIPYSPNIPIELAED